MAFRTQTCCWKQLSCYLEQFFRCIPHQVLYLLTEKPLKDLVSATLSLGHCMSHCPWQYMEAIFFIALSHNWVEVWTRDPDPIFLWRIKKISLTLNTYCLLQNLGHKKSALTPAYRFDRLIEMSTMYLNPCPFSFYILPIISLFGVERVNEVWHHYIILTSLHSEPILELWI